MPQNQANHDRRYINHMVLCNVALYKMKYLGPAPKSGRLSYPAAEGCSLQRSTGPFAYRSRSCSARFVLVNQKMQNNRDLTLNRFK